MNAKKNVRILAAAVLCAAMTAAPACMLAAETSAHVPNSVEAQQAQEMMPYFRNDGPFRGITVSRQWLRQVRLGGVLINIRLNTPLGEEITFHEMIKSAPSDSTAIALYLQASRNDEVITMQLDQPAIEALHNLGIVEIIVADMDGCVRAHYMVSELETVRRALSLADAEQLCVAGEDAPVTVVSEDGVRRQVNP